MTDHVVFNYSQISDTIWLGTNQCCVTHFDEDLLNLGISADISLEMERVDAPHGVESYLWIPVKDKTAPSQDQLAIGVAHMRHLLDGGKKIYVHCMNGHGRGPTLIVAYYISTGVGVDDAIAAVAEKRPEIHIEDVQREALHTFAAQFSL